MNPILKRLLQPFRALFRSSPSLDDGPHWTNFAGVRPTSSGVHVDERKALSLTAAYAAINVIATDTAALPLRVYHRRADGGRDLVTDHPAAELLSVSPDGETTAMRWRQAFMGHCLGWGNAYAEIEFDRGGRPLALHLLDPSICRPERHPGNRRLFYRIGPKQTDTLPPERVLHLAGLGFDGLKGYSPIQLAREAIALGLAAETFGAAFFGNGTNAEGVLEHPTAMSATAIENLRKSLEDIHGGPRKAHKLLILEEGMKFNATTIEPESAQFLETRQFQVVEVARIYRIPPHKIGDYSQSHLANIEASNLDYLQTTLMPWCEAQEQIFNFRLLTREERLAGYFIEHSMTALLRGDSKARAEFYTKLRDLGVLSPNDICKLENLNPIGPDGDTRLVPLNMVSLANAGQPAPTPGAPDNADAE